MSADEAADDKWLADFDAVDASIDIDSVGAENSQRPHIRIVQQAEVYSGWANQWPQYWWH